jgi:opacity protein-like surface antigen
MRTPLLVATTLALGAGVAHADESQFYFGAGISHNGLSGVTNDGQYYSNVDTISWKALAGFRPINPVAIELNYNSLGSESQTFFGPRFTHSDAKAFAAYGVGFLPVPMPYLDLFAKIGLARWQLSGSNSPIGAPPGTPFFSFSNNGTSFAWGAGAQVHMGNIGARLEYENFNIPNTNGVGVLSLEAIFTLPF